MHWRFSPLSSQVLHPSSHRTPHVQRNVRSRSPGEGAFHRARSGQRPPAALGLCAGRIARSSEQRACRGLGAPCGVGPQRACQALAAAQARREGELRLEKVIIASMTLGPFKAPGRSRAGSGDSPVVTLSSSPAPSPALARSLSLLLFLLSSLSLSPPHAFSQGHVLAFPSIPSASLPSSLLSGVCMGVLERIGRALP